MAGSARPELEVRRGRIQRSKAHLLEPRVALGHFVRVMKQRHSRWGNGGARHWATPFVLALLCLRAFVPAGFMLAPVDGRLDVILCDSDAPGAVHHHHGGHDPSGHHPHTLLDPTCPYAQSAGPAPLPVLPLHQAPPLVVSAALPVELEQIYSLFGPVRHQSPRAPPHLA